MGIVSDISGKINEKKVKLDKIDLTDFETSQGEMVANIVDSGFKGHYVEAKNIIEAQYQGVKVKFFLGSENLNVIFEDKLFSKNPKKMVPSLAKFLESLDR